MTFCNQWQNSNFILPKSVVVTTYIHTIERNKTKKTNKMYVPEKYLEADKLMVGAVAGFFEVMAEAEKTNPAEAKDMMKNLKEIDSV